MVESPLEGPFVDRQSRVIVREQGGEHGLYLGLVRPSLRDALKRVLCLEELSPVELHLADAEVGNERRVARLVVGDVVEPVRFDDVALHVVDPSERVDAAEEVGPRVSVRHRSLGQLDGLVGEAGGCRKKVRLLREQGRWSWRRRTWS